MRYLRIVIVLPKVGGGWNTPSLEKDRGVPVWTLSINLLLLQLLQVYSVYVCAIFTILAPVYFAIRQPFLMGKCFYINQIPLLM